MVQTASAAITANTSAANQPGIHTSTNGATVVDINKASASGVSHNIYSEFNVDKNGVVLNNSTAAAGTNTQLAGKIDANSNLAGKSATVILNEVRSADPSQLNGMVEVAGQSAKVIIANPSGITCDGCGFINADRATLTTGTANMTSAGKLTGIDVTRGDVVITGAGMDVNNNGKPGYTDIIARSVKLNAKLQANNLNVITGANRVTPQGSIQAIAGTGAAPTLAVDASSLGSMYAGKIRMMGTEQGVGVRLDGSDLTAKDTLSLSLDGKLENLGGHIESGKNGTINVNALSNTRGGVIAGDTLQIRAYDQLVNDAATLHARQGLDINAKAVENKNGGLLRSDKQFNLIVNEGGVTQQNARMESVDDISIDSIGKINNVDSTITAQRGSAYVFSNDDINNLNSTIASGRGATISSINHQVTNTGTIKAQSHTSINAASVINRDGVIQTESGMLNINANNLIDNRNGVISNADSTFMYNNFSSGTNLSAKTIDNRAGKITGKGNVSVTTYNDWTGYGQGINNDEGLISADGELMVYGTSLRNSGSIRSQGNLSMNISGTFSNTGEIKTPGRLKIEQQPEGPGTANASGVNRGTISGGDVFVSTPGDFTNEGAINTGRLNLIGNSIVNKGSVTSQTDLMLSGSTIDNQQNAVIASEGNVEIYANHVINATDAKITGQSVTIKAAQIDNTGFITPGSNNENGGSDNNNGGNNNSGGSDNNNGGNNNSGGSDNNNGGNNNNDGGGNNNGGVTSAPVPVDSVTYKGKLYSVGQVVNGQKIIYLSVYPNGDIWVTTQDKSGSYRDNVFNAA
ncbi:filamentous hemagglutinin N-terminal domain-containing protein [Cronobacter malonaticus]